MNLILVECSVFSLQHKYYFPPEKSPVTFPVSRKFQLQIESYIRGNNITCAMSIDNLVLCPLE